jgi:phytoene synthase
MASSSGTIAALSDAPNTLAVHDGAREAAQVASDLAHCRALLAAGSKSFSAASLLLPRRVRDDAAVFYAFCRVADDAVDLSDDPTAAVEGLRARLDRIFAAAAGRGTVDDDPVDRALTRVIAAHDLPRAPFDALIDGFVWDAGDRTYETESDTIAYSVRVAATIGVVMTYLMGVRDAATLARACDLGIAMQLTNIARDVGEDCRRGRVYLPATWLREAGVDPQTMGRTPRFTPELGRVVARLLDRADELYRRSEIGILDLPRDCRASIRAARIVYADIGRVIRARGCDSVTTRASTTTLRKVWLLGLALLGVGGRTRVAGSTAALPEAEILLVGADRSRSLAAAR